MTNLYSYRTFLLPFFVLFFSLHCFFATAQQNRVVKLLHADNIQFDKNIVEAQRLIGNVSLQHEGTLFYCDSAYLYANQNFDAFGNIRVNREGKYTVKGDVLFFDQSKKLAKLNRNTVLQDNEMTLTSDNIVYNLETEVASYFSGGKIVSEKNKNVLTSREGNYNAKNEIFYFKKNVVLNNPEYTVKSDTLQYNNSTEVTYFFGPTTIVSDSIEIYCENGWYNTKNDISQFSKNARITSGKTVLLGDSVFYNGKMAFGEVFKNVSIRDTSTNYSISGNYGKHLEKKKESFVTGRALMTQVFDKDSLFLHADTLLTFPDTSGISCIYAFHRVRIFKNDIQGVCDSLTYSEADSTIRLFRKPVLWNEKNQITGDSISIRTWKGSIERMVIRGNAFIVSLSEADSGAVIATDSASLRSLHFNQISGRNATGYFSKNKLTKIIVSGNGRMLYFPTDDKFGKPKVIGLNKGECSDIEIGIIENKIQRIKLVTEPNSVFTPQKMTLKNEFLLDGMNWRGTERPEKMLDIFDE
ncbi:MAG: hypothetical protein IT223_11290 [Crocinitomicaceae bacterium]|nr:hypothetical protein [Crocinitomicaceae bacterium]